MFTRRETRMMEKGFYPSRCGTYEAKHSATDEVITGLGDIKNRQQRRGNFTGNHRKKGGILKIIGATKFRSQLQLIPRKVMAKKGQPTIINPRRTVMNWHEVK